MSIIKNWSSASTTEIGVSESVFSLKTGNGCPLPHFLSVAKVTIGEEYLANFSLCRTWRHTSYSADDQLHQTWERDWGYWQKLFCGQITGTGFKCFWNSFPEWLSHEMAGKYPAASGTDNLWTLSADIFNAFDYRNYTLYILMTKKSLQKNSEW